MPVCRHIFMENEMGIEAFGGFTMPLAGAGADAYGKARKDGDSHDVAYQKGGEAMAAEDKVRCEAGQGRNLPVMRPALKAGVKTFFSGE